MRLVFHGNNVEKGRFISSLINKREQPEERRNQKRQVQTRECFQFLLWQHTWKAKKKKKSWHPAEINGLMASRGPLWASASHRDIIIAKGHFQVQTHKQTKN